MLRNPIRAQVAGALAAAVGECPSLVQLEYAPVCPSLAASAILTHMLLIHLLYPRSLTSTWADRANTDLVQTAVNRNLTDPTRIQRGTLLPPRPGAEHAT